MLCLVRNHSRVAVGMALCLGWVGVSTPAASGQAFADLPTALPGVRSSSVSWGDFDNDGDLDVLLAGETGSGPITRVYRNDGGLFTDLAAGLPGISDGAAVWGDYNGDGYLDIALTGNSAAGRTTRVYRNNANNTFTDLNAGLPGLEASTIAWGDYDNDGDLDFFLTGYTGAAYVGALYRNQGGDAFADSGVTTIRGGASGSAAWADFDKDGDLDLLLSGFTLDTPSGQSSRLYRNNNGAFVNFTDAALTAMSESSASWGDYDNDGDLDLLMAGSSISGVQSFPTLRLYRNNSGGAGFTSVTTTGMAGAQHCSVSWGDLDNDGDLDVALAGYNTSFQPSAKIYRNDGGGFFTDLAEPLAGVIEASLAWGDYDNDGDLDLLLAGHTGTANVTRLYRNDSPAVNSVPFSPISLFATIVGRDATLSWEDGGDANQFGGASFNLRVGTAPNGADIMNPMAQAGGGYRRVPRLGNVNQDRSWKLNLPVGAYYWSVQAVDHAFAGSPFAAEQTFIIPPQAPQVTTLPATNVTESRAVLRGTVNPNGDAATCYFQYGTTTNYGSTTAVQEVGGVADLAVNGLVTNLFAATTYHFRLVASNGFGVRYGTNRSFATPLFAELTATNLLGVGGGSVAWGDYDRDGDLDLLVAGANATGAVTRVYRNEAGTNFLDVQATLPGIHSGAVAWGDYDNDGDLDILLTGNFLSRVYRNDGGSVFTDLNLGLPGLSTGASGAWADFDSDGDLDFAITGAGGLPVKTYRNDGGDQFTDLPNALPRLSQSAMAWADYDRDGDMDLLVNGYNYGVGGLFEMTRLFRNDGRGSFMNSNLGFQSVADGSLAWGDYDNDGDLDILLTGGTGVNRYSMIYSNSPGGFVSVTITASVPRMDHSSVAWGDYDNDGDLDFVAAGMTSTGAVTKLFRNDGGTLFRDSGAALPFLGIPAVAWGDCDKDGRLDLVLAGYTGSNYVTKIFRNLSPIANTAPTAPATLSASVTGNSVTLAWADAADPNQFAGLTYNVRVGTAPGLEDVLGPMAGGPSGFRLVPALGNAGVRRNAPLRDLVVGTYYWSVQAVDHAFAGSPFSSNGSFTVSAALLPPVAVSGAATNIGLESVTFQGVANAQGAPTAIFFQYGTTTNFGSVAGFRDIGSGITNVTLTSAVSGLAEGAVYYFRLGASNLNGVTFGATLSFTSRFQFSDVPTALPPVAGGYFSWAGAVEWGDADNDGDLDVAVSSLSLGSTQVFRNDGGDVFVLAQTNLPPAYYGTLDWGDYDSDGDLDLLIGGSPTLAVARNDGDGSFSLVTTNQDGLYGTEFATWVDYDGDGDLDISCYDYVGSNASFAQARLYRNDHGTFVPSDIPMPQLTAGWMAWGDYDSDGDPDLAMTGQIVITNQILRAARVYRNDGNGEFTDIEASITGLEDGRVAWGDVDNDGDPDLLLNGTTPPERLTKVYRNDHGIFIEANANLPGAAGPMTLVDYDNDGDLDVMLQQPDPNESYTTNRIFRNTGAGEYVDSGKFVLYLGRRPAAAWADYDRDGDLDALIAGRLRGNNILFPNSPPSPPDGLSSSRTGNLVTLQWNPTIDENQSGGFTYNVQIGTAPGNYDIQSGAAESATGWRRVAKPGHATSPTWKLNLPVGDYFWRVQAIDHGLAGSAFSTEGTFTIPVLPPQAVTRLATTNAIGHPTVNGSVNPNGLVTSAHVEYGVTNFEFRTAPQILGGGTAWLDLSVALTGLTPERTYLYRVVASNSLGTSVGGTRSFFRPFFSEPPGTLSGHSWVDTDQDGDLDVLYRSTYGTTLFRNDHGTLTNLYLGFADAGEGTSAWGDYDNDGDLDLLLAGRDSSFNRRARLYRNDGGNQFALLTVPLTGVYQGAAAWADLDNDGELDLLVTGADSQNKPLTQLLLNEGTNGFARARHSLPAVMRGAVACADYDSDGDVDVLMAGATEGGTTCRLYRNDGSGLLTDSGATFPGFENGALSWGDYDGDGDPDILLNGGPIESNLVARVYRNDGGTFVDAEAGLPGFTGGSAWIDYDNDGRLDIVLKGTLNTFASRFARVYRNLGNGQFADANLTLRPPNDSFTTVVAGDYDNDGDVDLGFGEQGVLRNEGNVPNAPPAAPAGLEVAIVANSAVLKWEAASDPNQDGGLTYNVRVGTTPGAGDVVSGMAMPGTGRRLLPEMGNAFGRLDFVLRHLRVGSYYWSVQAIDHSRAASPFSGEGSFVIPVQAPSIVPLSISNLLGNSVTLNARVNPNGSSAVAYFQYGVTTNYGMQTSPVNLGSGTSELVVSALVGGLNNITPYHYRMVASNSLGIRYGADRAFATPQFTEVDLGLPPAPGTIAPGDYDNDRDLDFLLAVHSGSPTLLFRNDGPGGFANTGMNFPALNGASLDWGDYDRDGDPDLLLLGFNATRIYRNDQGVLTNINANLPLLWGSGRWGDYDNDGDLDVLISTGGNCSVYRNLGGNSFALEHDLQGVGGFAAWGDYDNDGDLDFAVAGRDVIGVPLARLIRNDGPAGFSDSGVDLAKLHGQVAWGDCDNDGDLDLLLCGSTSSYVYSPALVRLYRNDGGGTFVELPTTLPNVNGNILWADFDNDGDLDVLMSGTINWPRHAGVFRNDGNGTFTDIGAGFIPVSGDGLACGDFDGDGDLDFLLSGYMDPAFDYVTRLYRNHHPISNSPPNAPFGLSATISSNAVTLAWLPGTDPNQTGGLSYNLRVGTAPGAGDVISPMADVASGWRKVPVLGNVQANLRWQLRNLAPGRTYYWSVQAVDHSFAGSVFAPEQSFLFNNAPVAHAQLIVLPEDTTVAVTLAGSDVDGQALGYTVLAPPTNGVLSGLAPGLSYRPKTNFFGVDRITLQVHDGFTNSAPAVISLVITPVTDQAFSRVGMDRGAGGLPRLTVAGEPFERYAIEASEDLVRWTALPGLLDGEGLGAVIDADAGTFPWRFYRAAMVPSAASINGAQWTAGGFQMSVAGELARRFTIEASTNLRDWTAVTNLILTTSPLSFTDPAATSFSHRFYRVRPAP